MINLKSISGRMINQRANIIRSRLLLLGKGSHQNSVYGDQNQHLSQLIPRILAPSVQTLLQNSLDYSKTVEHSIKPPQNSIFSFFNSSQKLSATRQLRRYFGSASREKDPYKVLNVPFTATEQQIKDSFKELAKKYHPDKDLSYEHRFREILQAYHILSNKKRRREYDKRAFGSKTDTKAKNSNSAAYGYKAGNQGGASTIPKPMNDPLYAYFRDLYKPKQKGSQGTEVPPHIRKEHIDTTGGTMGNNRQSKYTLRIEQVLIGIVVIAIFYRIDQVARMKKENRKNRKHKKPTFDREEEDRFVEEVNKKLMAPKQLTDKECKEMGLDQLEKLDFQKRIILPEKWKKRVEEFREVYDIDRTDGTRMQQYVKLAKKYEDDKIKPKVQLDTLNSDKDRDFVKEGRDFSEKDLPNFNFKNKFNRILKNRVPANAQVEASPPPPNAVEVSPGVGERQEQRARPLDNVSEEPEVKREDIVENFVVDNQKARNGVIEEQVNDEIKKAID